MDHHDGQPASIKNQPGPIEPSSSTDEVSEHLASDLVVLGVLRSSSADMPPPHLADSALVADSSPASTM
jgi:hypothetical protein